MQNGLLIYIYIFKYNVNEIKAKPYSSQLTYIESKVIRTLHDWLSQMNENLLISNSKLMSDSELIRWRQSTNLSSFVRDSHVGCVLYNGKVNHYQIRSWIQIMRNVRVLSNHERALLAHPCTFGEKIWWLNLHHTNDFPSFNHYHSIKITTFPW